MDYTLIYNLYTKQKLIDLELILDDSSNKIVLNIHKFVLLLHSTFFEKLFTFSADFHSITIKVPDANIAKDLILSFYGQHTNSNDYPKWRHQIALAKARDYFGVEQVPIEVPEILTEDSYDYFLELCAIVGFDEDSIGLLMENLPPKYDLKRLSSELILKMIDSGTYHIITTIYDNYIKLWNVFTGELVYTLNHKNPIQEIFFYRNRKFFTTVSDNECNIWLAATGTLYHSIKECVVDLDFSPDKLYCVLAFDDYCIKKFDLVNKIFSGYFDLDFAHTTPINYVKISYCGKYIATGDMSGMVKLWDFISMKHLYDLEGNSKGVKSINFSLDLSLIVSKNIDNEIHAWVTKLDQNNIVKIEAIEILAASFRPYVYSEMSDKIYIAKRHGTGINIIDFKTNSIINFFDKVEDTTKILFSADCKFIALRDEKFLCLYNIAIGFLVHSFLKTFAFFTPDNKYFVAALKSSLQIIDLNNYEYHTHLEAHHNIKSIGHVLQENVLMYNTRNQLVKLYDMKHRSVINTMKMTTTYSDSVKIYNGNAQRLLEIIE